jgi:hypothetical protein
MQQKVSLVYIVYSIALNNGLGLKLCLAMLYGRVPDFP